MENKKQMVEIWGDVVDTKSLIVAIIISIVSTMGFYSLAPNGDRTKGLFFGLMGAVIGFVISAVFIKPKRIIVLEEKTEE